MSLGSGTSGGVLAPVFMIGGALGAAEGMVLPHVFPGFWAMLGLAAVVGGVMRSPLTGVIFTLELTHAWPVILPLLIASTSAYALSALTLKRSVLTEKIARRGVHVNHEYSVDPLEVLFVADVMGDSGTAEAEGPFVFADDTLRHVAYVMADSGRTELPVAERALPGVPIGTVRLEQLLEGRLRDLDEERHRTRVLRPFGLLGAGREAPPVGKS